MLVPVAIVCLSTAVVLAQPGGGGGRGGQGGGPGGPGGPGGMMGGGRMGATMMDGGGGFERLLRDDQIRQDVGLSEDQVQKLTALRDEMRNAPRPQFTPPDPNASQEDRMKAMQQMRTEMEKRVAEQRSKVEAILTTDQRKKVEVIAFQAVGGLNSPRLRTELLAPLNLTDAQKAQIKKLTEEAEVAQREMFASMGPRPGQGGGSPEEMRGRFEEMRTKMEALGQKTADQIKAVLTPEQKALGEKLTTEGAALRERLGAQQQQRGRGGNNPQEGGEGYRPGENSWQPGQGTPPAETRPRRGFPRDGAPQE